MKTGWIQYAESYKGECDNQALGPRRAKEVSDNVGALLPWCFCNFVMPLIFDLLCLLYQNIFFFFFGSLFTHENGQELYSSIGTFCCFQQRHLRFKSPLPPLY